MNFECVIAKTLSLMSGSEERKKRDLLGKKRDSKKGQKDQGYVKFDEEDSDTSQLTLDEVKWVNSISVISQLILKLNTTHKRHCQPYFSSLLLSLQPIYKLQTAKQFKVFYCAVSRGAMKLSNFMQILMFQARSIKYTGLHIINKHK